MNLKAKIGEKLFQLVAESESDTIESLKKLLETISNISYLQQKWVFQGKILTNSQTVREANLKEESCVIVIVSKTATPAAPALTASSTSNSTMEYTPTNLSQPSIPSAVSTVAFDRAMHILLANPEQTVEECTTLLLKIANNIVNNPNEDKYRKISSTNAKFSKKVQSVQGGVACMEGLGFKLNGTDWILFPTAEAWEILVNCKSKLEKFIGRLQAVKASGEQKVPVASASTIPSITPTIADSSSLNGAGVGTFANTAEPGTLKFAAANSPPLDLVAAQLLQALALQNIIPPSTVNATPATTAPVSHEMQLHQQENLKPAAEPASTDSTTTVNVEPQVSRSSPVTDSSETPESTSGTTTDNSD